MSNTLQAKSVCSGRVVLSIRRACFIAIFAAVVVAPAFAQDEPVIMRAMRDELNRNMSELVLEGFSKPFFISYTVTDSREISVNASMGGILRSSDFTGRSKYVRVMVGDYDFNDESLDLGRGNGQPADIDIDMPVDDDYFGLRRSLWITTDAIYRSAAKTFKDNQNFVKEQKKELKDIPHRSFSRAPVTQLRSSVPFAPVDRGRLEDLARELSLIFNHYGDIVSSNVFVQYYQSIDYFINSEGTLTTTTDNTATITVNAMARTDDGEIITDHISHTGFSLEKLPNIKYLTKEIAQMAERLTSLRKTEVFKDNYTGPVLFIGPAAIDVFTTSLFSVGEALVASKNITNSFSASDAKLGKKILDGRFTVKSTPKITTFNDTELLGSYQVDDEGVIPPDDLVLIEGGILKNLLTDRTVTKEGQQSNGHGSGPGVIAVSSSDGVTVDSLKQQLLEKAKEEGLEYALIVRHFATGNIRSMNTYKVSLSDGSEQLVRSANVRAMNIKSLKRVMGVSSSRTVRNTDAGRFGGTISIIAPDAILLEEVEVEGARSNPFLDKAIYVENPTKN